MRSEAQKKADKKYKEKNKNKYAFWGTSFTPEESEQINKVLSDKGISKADFIRWAMIPAGCSSTV